MGNRLSKIYTRTGDQGETGLADGRRVSKCHPRIEAMGAVDELNCQLGVLLAAVQEDARLDALRLVLEPIQHRLFDIGGELAMPEYRALQDVEIHRLEQAIDHWNAELGPLQNFILPGGSSLVAQAHLCRAQARHAERRCLQLHGEEPLSTDVLCYLNRLSDLLFVVARLIARRQGIAEVLWQAAEKPA